MAPSAASRRRTAAFASRVTPTAPIGVFLSPPRAVTTNANLVAVLPDMAFGALAASAVAIALRTGADGLQQVRAPFAEPEFGLFHGNVAFLAHPHDIAWVRCVVIRVPIFPLIHFCNERYIKIILFPYNKP